MLQTSGPISIIDLVNEFEPANLGSLTPPHSLSEFYSVAAGIPTSGTIDLDDFYGASAVIPPTTVTVTEGEAYYYQDIFKARYFYDLYGYFANAEEVNVSGTSSWSVSSAGSRSPTTFNGVTIEALAFYTNTFLEMDTFYFLLQGNRPQNFFTSILPQGSELELASSAATSYTYDATGNYTKWSWSKTTETNPFGVNNTIDTNWDGTGTSTVVITP